MTVIEILFAAALYVTAVICLVNFWMGQGYLAAVAGAACVVACKYLTKES